MVECSNEDCEFRWYHVCCLGRYQALTGDWWCDYCAPSRPRQKEDVPLEANMEAVDDVADHMGSVRVGEEVEDVVTKAVGESLEAMILA